MTTRFAADPGLSSGSQLNHGCGTDQDEACLALFTKMEGSLRDSQQAVLSRDVTRLQQCTAGQISLLQELRMQWPKESSKGESAHDASVARASKAPAHENRQAADDLLLVEAARRVLHLGRVQAALLRRAQQSLRAVSNLMAGRQAGYITLPGSSAIALEPTPLPSEED